MQNEIVPTSRQVIENKLLTALQDEHVVAALLTLQDLNVLIGALRVAPDHRARDLAQGLAELRGAAFGVFDLQPRIKHGQDKTRSQ